MAQMKEQNRIPEKELSDVAITNLLDTGFKTLVIRMPRDFIEYSKSIREEMKPTVTEIEKNSQETNDEGEEAGIQINNLEH